MLHDKISKGIDTSRNGRDNSSSGDDAGEICSAQHCRRDKIFW